MRNFITKRISPAALMIIVSIIAAAAILVASRLLAGHASAQTVTFIIIAIWFVPFSILAARGANKEAKDK